MWVAFPGGCCAAMPTVALNNAAAHIPVHNFFSCCLQASCDLQPRDHFHMRVTARAFERLWQSALHKKDHASSHHVDRFPARLVMYRQPADRAILAPFNGTAVLSLAFMLRSHMSHTDTRSNPPETRYRSGTLDARTIKVSSIRRDATPSQEASTKDQQRDRRRERSRVILVLSFHPARQTAAGASTPPQRLPVLNSSRPHALRYRNLCVR